MIKYTMINMIDETNSAILMEQFGKIDIIKIADDSVKDVTQLLTASPCHPRQALDKDFTTSSTRGGHLWPSV